MHRKHFLQLAGALSAGALLPRSAAALFQQTGLTPVRRGVYLYTERGGTIGLLASEGRLVAVDSQFPDTAARFIAEAKKVKDAPFAYLLNSHHHGDHTGGNVAFRGLTEHVMAHEHALGHQRSVAEKAGKLSEVLLPDLTFTGEAKLRVGDETVRGHYFGAAHTNGDAVWHFEEADVAHLGDLLFNRRHPFVDRAAGANMRHWIEVLEKTKGAMGKNTLYIYGHSGTGFPVQGKAEDLTRFQDYLDKVLRFAEAEIRKGVSKEDFIKNTEVPGVTEWTGDGLQRPLTAAYEEVSSKQ